MECHHKSHISVTGTSHQWSWTSWGVRDVIARCASKILFCPFPLPHHSNLISSAALAACSNVYQVVLWIHFHHAKASYILHIHVYNFGPFIFINSRVIKGRSLCFLLKNLDFQGFKTWRVEHPFSTELSQFSTLAVPPQGLVLCVTFLAMNVNYFSP